VVNTNFPTEWIEYVRTSPEEHRLPKIIVYLVAIMDLNLISELWAKLTLLRYRKKLIKKLNSAKTLYEWIEIAEHVAFSYHTEEYLETR